MAPESQICSPEGTTTTLQELLKDKNPTQEELDNLKKELGADPIKITCERLKALKEQIASSDKTGAIDAVRNSIIGGKPNSPEKAQTGIDYKNKLEAEGYSFINLDNFLGQAKSDKIHIMRAEYEPQLRGMLNKFDFLDETSKNIIIVALAKRLLGSEIVKQTSGLMSSFGDLSKMISPDVKKLTKAEDTLKGLEEAGKTGEEVDFKKIIEGYVSGFTKVNDKLNSLDPKLTSLEKQNIVNNIPYFRDLNAIETGPISEDIINKITLDKRNIKINDKEIPKDQLSSISAFLTKFNTDIQTADKGAIDSENQLDMALNITEKFPALGNILQKLLGNSFLGKILAFFLGLDNKDPLGDFNSRLDLKRFIGGFTSLGATLDKSGSISKKGVGIFEEIDLSEIKIGALKDGLKKKESGEKGEIDKLIELQGDSKPEDFWQKIFTSGVEFEGVNLKFDLIDKYKQDKKLTSLEFIQIVKNAFDIHNKAKEIKTAEEQKKARKEGEEQKLEEQKQTISALETNREKVVMYDKILAGEYKNITNWNNTVGKSIDDIEISKLIASGDDFSSVITNTIGADKYKAITDASRPLLAETLVLIRDFCKSKSITTGNIKDIVGGGIVERAQSKTNRLIEFNEFVKEKREPFAKEIEKTNQKIEDSRKEQEKVDLTKSIENTINGIQNPTKLSSKVGKLFFNPGTQELDINGEKYKVSITTELGKFDLNDIIIDKDKVTLNIRNSPINKDIKKVTVIEGIYDLITKGRFESKKDKDGNQMVIEKIGKLV
ncbi:MAG: hypothetical protein PHE25_00200 [Candidatus Gracilibacteria bacterium]|nr:hypothetical protein [Candidatus Gracilibacteria bacterium]